MSVRDAQNVGSQSSAVRSTVARALALAPTALATLLTSRIVITHWGISAFGSYAIIVTLLALLPLNNLGVGAPVTNAYATDGPESDHARKVTLTSARTLAVSTAVTAAASTLLAVTGLWPTLLGAASGPNAVSGLAVAVWAVGFLPGLGQSMLLGLHKNHIAVVMQALLAPLTLALVGVGAVTGLTSGWVMVAPGVAIVLTNVLLARAAARASHVSWRWILRALPFPARWPGASIRAIAAPLLVTSISVPIALQSDRLVLSHVSTTQAVANYSVAIQLFAPLLALIGAAAQPLWPMYAHARARGERGPALHRVLALFVGLSGAASAVLVGVADPLGRLIGAGEVQLGILLPVAAALSTTTQAATFPIAMTLMHPRGARFIATTTTLSLPVNIGLSIVLARSLGAAGPLLATAVAGAAFGVVAPLAARSRLARPRSVGRHALRR